MTEFRVRNDAISEVSAWIEGNGPDKVEAKDAPSTPITVLGLDAIELLIDAYRGAL